MTRRPTPRRLPYPPAPQGDVFDDYHGEVVADPYRWLEDPDDEATRRWIEAENRLTKDWLAEVPQRAGLRRDLHLRWDVPRRGALWRRGGWWFQMRNTGLENQDVLWVAPDRSGQPDERAWTALLDPNTLSPDGTTALSAVEVSSDGRLAAYATSEAGSDWLTWRVLDVPDGSVRDDVVAWSKFSSAAWTRDGAGFFYAAYDPPPEGRAHRAANRDQRLWYHRLGTHQRDDVLVYARPDEPEWGFLPWVSHDGRWLVVTVWRGTDPATRIYVADLRDRDVADVDLVPRLDRADAAYDVIGVHADRLLLRTDLEAPRGRVVAIALPDAATPLEELVGETDVTIEDVRLVGGGNGILVGRCLQDATHRLQRWSSEGRPLADLELPDLGTVGSLATSREDAVVHLTFETFTRPSRVLRVDARIGSMTVVYDPLAPGEAGPSGEGSEVATVARPEADAVTEQHWVRSADGTRVPVFLVHRREVTPGNGPHPTLLWGYGGFNIPITPMYRTPWAVWIARGGVLAVPNLRGGGEFGRAWHDDGRLANKQHTFDDAIAAAEWLAAAGWTSPAHLAVAGASNGGLLVGACLTQRPELFGAAVAEVGVLDLLRFHRFTIGWGWRSDYGDPDDPRDFAVLRAYSPLHNLRHGRGYPATLLTTGDHDDRVVPAHSFKFAAALQAAQGGDEPVLIRVETDAGHGAGKPTAKIIEERADVLAFLVRTIGDPGRPRPGDGGWV